VIRRVAAVAAVLAAVVLAAGCSETPAEPDTLILLTHDSFAIPAEVLGEFTEQTGIDVEILTGGDAGAMVNQAILTKDNPLADVLFGVDNTFLSRALEAGIFAPHEAAGLESVLPELIVDPEARVTPMDFGDVCLNYDRRVLPDDAAPRDLESLTAPEHAGRLVVQDPATSSPGLAFLLATIATFPEDAAYSWQDYWKDLIANDVQITVGWEEAYSGAFSGGSGLGDRPIVVSYASSPPSEVIFSDPQPATAPTGVITASCFRQIEFAGVLAGSGNEEAAGRLVDFMLTRRFQEAMPLNMFVFPARRDASLPREFIEFTEVPADPITMSPDEIGERRDEWIKAWTELVR
jgi:thiamine transport system substrate-binding protein